MSLVLGYQWATLACDMHNGPYSVPPTTSIPPSSQEQIYPLVAKLAWPLLVSFTRGRECVPRRSPDIWIIWPCRYTQTLPVRMAAVKKVRQVRRHIVHRGPSRWLMADQREPCSTPIEVKLGHRDEIAPTEWRWFNLWPILSLPDQDALLILSCYKNYFFEVVSCMARQPDDLKVRIWCQITMQGADDYTVHRPTSPLTSNIRVSSNFLWNAKKFWKSSVALN